MKVGLIDPGSKELTASFPHLGLGYIASFLRKNSVDVCILDISISRGKEIEDFLNQNLDLVGITTTSATYDAAVKIASKVKAETRNRNTKVVFGGPHVGIASEESLIRSSVIDYAVYGEGEYTIVELTQLLNDVADPAPNKLQKIRGLIFRKGKSIVVNKPRPWIKNVDSLPFPAWDLFPMHRYDQHVLLTSRGCPYNCSFCAVPVLWGRHWRPRSVNNVIDEIEWVVSAFGKKPLYISDDNFTLDTQRVESFCEMVRQLDIEWFCQGVRADRVTEIMLRKMKEAGCFGIALGVESANPRVLKNIDKGESVEDIVNAVNMIKRVGINVHGLFMIGNIGDTYDTVRESIDFAIGQNFTTFDFYLALPYPKTRLWEYIEKNGWWINRDYTRFDHFSNRPVFETSEFSARERMKVYRLALRASRKAKKKYYLNTLKHVLRGDLKLITKYRIKQFFKFLARV